MGWVWYFGGMNDTQSQTMERAESTRAGRGVGVGMSYLLLTGDLVLVGVAGVCGVGYAIVAAASGEQVGAPGWEVLAVILLSVHWMVWAGLIGLVLNVAGVVAAMRAMRRAGSVLVRAVVAIVLHLLVAGVVVGFASVWFDVVTTGNGG